jgi:predicted Zn-dependent peptidase
MTGPRATLPVLPPPAPPHLPPVHRFQLDNALELLVVEQPELPVVDARLVVRAGAALDPGAVGGRAALTAELLDEGTAALSALDIADEAEHLGARLHTRAAWDDSVAALHVLTPRLEPALELLAEITLHAAFPAAEVERKRAERLAAILQELDEPRIRASHAFGRAVYGAAHPFGAPLGGTRESVERLGRQELVTFYQTRYTPANAFLVLAGDITAGRAYSIGDRLFSSWSGAAPARDAALESPVPRKFLIHVVDRPGAPQSELRVGVAGPPRCTPDYFPLLVGNTVLGGAFTSRLNMRLREEKAYTYGAASRFAFRADGGPFAVATAVFTGATADAVNDVVREIARLGREPVSTEELERAQSYLVLGLPRTFETTADIAEHVSEVALYGLGRDFFDTYAERVRAVTAEQVIHAVARWLAPERLVVVIVGDAAAIVPELTSLELGTVEIIDAN